MARIMLLICILILAVGCETNEKTSTDFIEFEENKIPITEIAGEEIQQDDDGYYVEIQLNKGNQ